MSVFVGETPEEARRNLDAVFAAEKTVIGLFYAVVVRDESGHVDTKLGNGGCLDLGNLSAQVANMASNQNRTFAVELHRRIEKLESAFAASKMADALMPELTKP